MYRGQQSKCWRERGGFGRRCSAIPSVPQVRNCFIARFPQDALGDFVEAISLLRLTEVGAVPEKVALLWFRPLAG